jgi:tetratricopeptide (TPR) repeat protein
LRKAFRFEAAGNWLPSRAVELERRTRMRRTLFVPILSLFLAIVAEAGNRDPLPAQATQSQSGPSGQSSQQQSSSKGYSSSAKKQSEAQSPDDNPNQAPDVHKYDRLNAEKDIDVATFYLHKGDPDAAIPRLEEASRLRPDYGKPRLLLAQCYEKKHDAQSAIKYLKEYLKVYPHAPDAEKVRKKIEQLQKQAQ